MIILKNVTKSYLTTKGRTYVFKNLNLVLPPDKNIALVGRNGVGKSTLMRLLGGQDVPDSGQIITDKSISWPVGLSGGFQGSLTGRQNSKFVARIQGVHGDEMRKVVQFVEDFADIGKYFDLPVNSYSSGMRGRVAFGLSLAFDFDYYLVDEAISVGDARFREKAQDLFVERTGRANLILVSHGMGQVRKMCNHVVLLKPAGEVEQYEDVEEGIAAYQNM